MWVEARPGAPVIELSVFWSPVSSRAVEPADAAALFAPIGREFVTTDKRGTWWRRSSGGIVRSTALADHVDWLVREVIAPREAAFAKLRTAGYWTSVFFHAFEPPASDARAAADARFEPLGFTFDFELER